MGVEIREKSSCVTVAAALKFQTGTCQKSLPLGVTALFFAVAAACLFAHASAAPLPGARLPSPNESPENNVKSAETLSDLVALKAQAVEARRHALVLLREVRSLNDSISAANKKIQAALAAQDKLKVTSARLAEQRKVVKELSAIVDKTAERMFRQLAEGSATTSRTFDSESGSEEEDAQLSLVTERDSEEARLSLVTAGEAKLVAERLAARVARRVMRLRDKADSYGVAVTCRDEMVKVFELRLPHVLAAEEKAEEAARDYFTAWRRAMETFPEIDVLEIVQSASSDSGRARRATDILKLLGGAGQGQLRGEVSPGSVKDDPFSAEIDDSHGGRTDLGKQTQKLRPLGIVNESRQAVEEVAAADAEEAVARGLLNGLRAEIQAWKSSIAEVRASEDLQKLKRLRQEQENAEGDAQFADFQVKESEKDLQQARALVAETMEMVEEQKKILQEAEQAVARAMAVEAKTHTLRARMLREEAELVTAQAERVAGAMVRKMKRAEMLVLERTQGLQAAQLERENAAKKASELGANVKEMGERYGRSELAAKEDVRLMNLLKPVVLTKHGEARAARLAWGRFLILGKA
ncbi:hypothetical protein CLOM_g7177 [Closterium sp. NIES-68]|nr:hypothetical protein CLOM_g7177 [Closterium sp. NIES-68]GJP78982.1 hypothetical protein CLOP_g9239 [Closterium sp. NIES-67]